MSSRFVRPIIRVAAIVFVVAATRRLVWMPWMANRTLAEVGVRSNRAIRNGDPMTTALAARRNIDALNAVASVCRTDANYYMLYAANASMLDRLASAADAYSAALSNADHRPEIYYERGLVYMRMGKLDAAVADLARAARFKPTITDDLSGELKVRVTDAAGLK